MLSEIEPKIIAGACMFSFVGLIICSLFDGITKIRLSIIKAWLIYAVLGTPAVMLLSFSRADLSDMLEACLPLSLMMCLCSYCILDRFHYRKVNTSWAYWAYPMGSYGVFVVFLYAVAGVLPVSDTVVDIAMIEYTGGLYAFMLGAVLLRMIAKGTDIVIIRW